MRIPLRLCVGMMLGLGACVGTVEGDIDSGAMNTSEGGALGAAGARGAGGQNGPGGAIGSGGATGAGGATEVGGATGSGGMTGSAGRNASGGMNGSGAGGSGTGGTPAGVGGNNGVGGRNAAGGSTGSGGAGGTPGLGPWTTGYAATMYGNDTSGDCAGYPNFSDMTSIRSPTCSTGRTGDGRELRRASPTTRAITARPAT